MDTWSTIAVVLVLAWVSVIVYALLSLRQRRHRERDNPSFAALQRLGEVQRRWAGKEPRP